MSNKRRVKMTDRDLLRTAELADQIANRIAPLLAGKGPMVQGAVLALLTARWVCGHQIASEREVALTAHCEGLRAIVADICSEDSKPH